MCLSIVQIDILPKYDARGALLTPKHSCHLESEALTQGLQIVREFGMYQGREMV